MTGLLGEQTLMDKTFHGYMLAGRSGVLYMGITNNLATRVGA